MEHRKDSLTRRRFLATTAVVSATAATGLARPFATPALAQDGLKVLRVASGESDKTQGTVDPALSSIDPDSARIGCVFERLTRFDPDMNVVPQLATSWESDETATVWTFHLRENVRFSDGTPITAEDVVFSYRRLIDPEVGSPGAGLLSSLTPEGMEVVDDLTVRFTLTSPVVEFPSLITNRFTYIVKRGQSSEQLRTAGIGTGGFRIKQFVPGEEPVIFERNEHYWREGLPKFDIIELRSIPDQAAHVAALLSGQIDLSWDIPRSGVPTLEANPDVEVVTQRSGFVISMSMQVDKPPFDDVRVRTAMKLVIDRAVILDGALSGYGNLANDNPVAPWVPYGIEEEPKARDVEKAKTLLAEAGHPDGIDVELYTSEATPGFVEMATLYQALAADAGIRVTINRAPAHDYFANVWRKVPFCCTSKSGRTADEAMALFYLSDVPWNDTNWKNAEFDAAIAEARQTLDATRRTELYQKAQRLIQEDGGVILPVFSSILGAQRAGLTGWKLPVQKYDVEFTDVAPA